MAVVEVRNISGDKVSERELADGIFNVPVKNSVLHEIVRMQLASRRSGTAAVKRRSAVVGSTAKLLRPTGTGRARAGDVKSPLRRGGGVVFGPNPRSYAFKVPKKKKRLALKMALSSKLMDKELIVLDKIELEEIKTRTMVDLINRLDMKKPLIIIPSRDEKIELPLSLVKDSGGIFYVVDGANRSILYINVKKKIIEKLAIKGDFNGKAAIFPGRIAIDGQDRLYVIDKLHRRILIINNNGLFIKALTVNKKEFYGFNDVKVSTNGNVIALDTIGGAVYMFDSDGKVISTFGERDGDEKKFWFPVSLALDDSGFVYVLDGHASEVQVFDPSGNYRRTLLKKGANEGELMHPTYIYIDHESRIFIADQSRIQIFREEKE